MIFSSPLAGLSVAENKKDQPHRIAITGGRGRLAGLAAVFLKNQGYQVNLFSRTSGEGIRSLEELCNPGILASYTTILHMAWSSVPFTSEQNPGGEEKEDLPLLKKLLDALEAIKTYPPPKLIFLSSASVYGNTGDVAATETTFCHPLSGYSRAKLAAEKMIQTRVSEASVEALILRITNVVSLSGDPKKPQGILPRILAAAENQQVLEIWGDGSCSKDYLWSDDFLKALEASIIQPLRGLFNVGSGENFSLLELISFVEKRTKKQVSIIHRSHYAWDVERAHIDSSLFSQATAWSPQVNIRHTIEKNIK